MLTHSLYGPFQTVERAVEAAVLSRTSTIVAVVAVFVAVIVIVEDGIFHPRLQIA